MKPFKVATYNPLSKRREIKTVVKVAPHRPVDGGSNGETLYYYSDKGNDFDFSHNCEILQEPQQ